VPRWTGYKLIEKVEKWATKFPRDVRIVGVDDDYFTSSCLVLIEHQTEHHYMGTTAVFIPQCTGEPPTRFFLYPDRRNQLRSALQAIALNEKDVVKNGSIRRAKEARLLAQALTMPKPTDQPDIE
jgi:hypothetical protein